VFFLGGGGSCKIKSSLNISHQGFLGLAVHENELLALRYGCLTRGADKSLARPSAKIRWKILSSIFLGGSRRHPPH
jgi:hypothetical protein